MTVLSSSLHLSGQPVATAQTIQDSGTSTFSVRQGSSTVTVFFSGTPAEQHEQINALSSALFVLGMHVAQRAGLFDEAAA